MYSTCHPPSHPMRWGYYYVHLTEEILRLREVKVSCLWCHGWEVQFQSPGNWSAACFLRPCWIRLLPTRSSLLLATLPLATPCALQP